MASDFIHLHNHTHYSLQDGACTVDSLVKAAKKHNMHAVALTDHGVMFGIPEFYKKCKSEGIKPIIGMEAYITTEGSRFEKGGQDDSGRRKSKHYNHLILLAKNLQGYKNLAKLSSLAHIEGFYYRPRIDFELLEKYKEGLLATSACAGGVVSAHLVNGDYAKAKMIGQKFKDMFGDDFYLEIQDHNMAVEKPVLEHMPKLSRELGIKLVATNDCHYINQEDAIAHNILLLLSDKEGKDYRDLRYGTDQIYFKSSDEMKKLFKDYKGAIENTLEIEEKLDVNLDDHSYHFPVFPIPSDSPAKDLDGYFEQLSREGLNKYFPNADDVVKERFEFELKTIKEMGYSGYFLIVQDFINASRKMGIPVGPGRGSAAGSLIAYLLQITTVNPLDYDLLFERFLNPSRKSMPDIDVDFADDQREKVIEYVKEKYGSHCVSQIITFNRLSSKAVIRDVARVLKIPIPEVNKITKFIPSEFGKVYSIEKSIEEVAELKWLKNTPDENLKLLIKYGQALEGMNRNAGKHAAGVVIAPDDVSNFIPLATANKSEIVTQYNMKDVEAAGLLKMDFLGLRTLTIIRDAVDLVKKNHGIEIDIEEVPLDDELTYQLFCKGQTTGVFQFESAPMREYLKKLQPNNIKDLAAMNALYRPGPMDFIDDFIDRKFGRKNVEYLHPVLEPILKETYGIIVYQEQVIQIANKVIGMTLAEADNLRRAMGKKDKAAMLEQKVKFVEGAIRNNISKKTAEDIFEAIEQFANYGFNKSHAVAYSILAYKTAYMKAHYAPEFLAANLTNEFGNTDKVSLFLDDCRKLKIDVLPPNVNNPTVSFNVENGKIRFGMAAIKNVGINAVKEMERSREELKRNYTSIFDFCSNVDTRVVNKRALEGLVLAGAFDQIESNRASLFYSIENALDFGSKVQASKENEAFSLFAEAGEEVKIEEPKLNIADPWSEREQLSKERAVTGFFITNHPLKKYQIDYNSFADIQLGAEIAELEGRDFVRACGVITNLDLKLDKSGRYMAFFSLDDFYGSCECLMFAKTYEHFGKYVKDEECVYIEGRPESSGDAIKIHIESLIPLETIRNNFIDNIKIKTSKSDDTLTQLKKLNNLVEKNPGESFCYLELNGGAELQKFVLGQKIKINDQVIDDVSKIFDEESVILKYKNLPAAPKPNRPWERN